MHKPITLTLLSVALVSSTLIWAQDKSDKEQDKTASEQVYDPVDAMQQTPVPAPVYGQPQPGSFQHNELSQDIQQLQDAKRLYQKKKVEQAAEVRRSQQRCRESGNETVAIEDGTGGEGFCQDKLNKPAP